MDTICRLSELKSGDRAIVKGFERCGSECQYNLSAIGLRAGCEIEIVNKGHGGRVLINSSNGRVALGHGMAEKVIVSTGNK